MDSVKWSDLPKELWPIIGKFVHSRIDVLRFRGVCSLWRSCCPPFEPPPPPRLPLNLFFAFGAQNQASLLQSTIYRMESLIDDHQWLVKFEEHPESGKMRLLDPVTNSLLKHSPESTPKNLNLLEFRVFELRKSYGPSLRFGKSNLTIIKSVHRLVVMPRNHLDFGVVYAIFMIRKDGKLEFARSRDEKLTYVDEQNSHYNDIIVYKGQCYVVDKWGIISWVNSALEVIQFSPPLCGFGGQKHLVEYCGDLYVVDQYFEEVSCHHLNQDAEAIDFKVYKLDQEWGKWVNVKDLGGQVFILSNDGSFSVSTTEFAGVKGNCILFSIPGRTRCHSRVFSLEDGRIRNLASSQMLQLPSTWLNNLERQTTLVALLDYYMSTAT